jgi:hypothetical protein
MKGMSETHRHCAVHVTSTGEWFFPADYDALEFFELTREERDYVAAGYADGRTREILDNAVDEGRRSRVNVFEGHPELLYG